MTTVTQRVAAAAGALGLAFIAPAAAHALPSTALQTDAALQEMFAVHGNIHYSIDGLGINGDRDGQIQVEKAAGDDIVAAFLMAATEDVSAAPTDLTLNGQTVEFTHSATETASGFNFTNYFADVSALIGDDVANAEAGILDFAVNEGVSNATIEGTALVVIFANDDAPSASFVLNFGTANPLGDTFSLNYDALTAPQTDNLVMSIGSAYSYGSSQGSTMSVNGNDVADKAGHFDDCEDFVSGEEIEDNWTCNDGALITVGGIGDSIANPTLGGDWASTSDDELYSLSPFVTVGDTAVTVTTLNASVDDNIFFAGFYLEDIFVEGAVDVETLRTFTPELAETGLDSTTTGFAAGAGVLALVVAGAVMAVRARRSAK